MTPGYVGVMKTKTVKIAEARNNLSRLLAYVKKGGRVRILDRTTPVADLVPVEKPEEDADDEDWRYLKRLARRGVLRLGKPGPFPEELLEPGPPDPEGNLLKALLEERRTGR
jgi:prevent-host-death family protein